MSRRSALQRSGAEATRTVVPCLTALWESSEQCVRVVYYSESLAGENPADRIHLMIQPAGEAQRGWIMTISEAESIITGLEIAIERARADSVPEEPV